MGNNNQRNISQIQISQQNNFLVGFQNKPLTLCYANSILQVLFHHPVFANIILNSNQEKGIIMHLRQLLQNMKLKKSYESISTTKLMKFIQDQSAIFQTQHHQDSHQFFIWLLNQINDELKKQKKQTELQKEFVSKRVTRIKCLNCNTTSQTEQEQFDFSLFLPEPNVSLNNCIQQYSNIEKLSGANKFKCDKCDSLQQAQKRTLLKSLPNFLSIHLRRFKYDEQKKGMIKLNWLIPFPFKLKLRTNLNKQQQKVGMYKLVGVVAHLGQGQSYGHYISYIKIDKQWYMFNDDQIAKTDDYMLESLWGYKGMTKCAYMLFYSL